MRVRETIVHLFETQLARSLFALAVLVVVAIAGYMLIEGWSLLDAAYMTVVTFTTVGYEEVHPLSSTGRVFTMFLMVAGVGVMLYILTSVMHLIVAQEVLRNLVRRRRMRARMAKLNGHFIVCGFGRVGRAVALTLQEQSA
ncbi:MAG: two pore domain potassium channel family protein, partial [Chloroflexi bacterium]|nr:two pore domain potassium channel family protein [Chloroflexota bacterium]